MFAETHAVLLALLARAVHGLRIDHPDGLADPRGYLRGSPSDRPRLGRRREDPRGRRAAARRLAGRRHDRLRRAAARRHGAGRPGATAPSTELYSRCCAEPGLRRVVGEAKRLVVERRAGGRGQPAGAGSPPDLPRRLPARPHPARHPRARDGCSSAMPVYRTYVVPRRADARGVRRGRGPPRRPRGTRPEDRPRDAGPRRRAGRRRPTGAAPPTSSSSGPADLRAGDGQGRRGHRVLPVAPAPALNEVGGDPARFGVDARELHGWCARQEPADWPAR